MDNTPSGDPRSYQTQEMPKTVQIPHLPQPKKYGAWLMWAFVIAVILLMGSGVINILCVAMLGSSDGKSSSSTLTSSIPETYVMGENFSKNKILEINISGAIMDTEDPNNVRKNLVSRIRTELNSAEKDKSIKAILLTISSPGGAVTPTDIIWNDVVNFKNRTKIPIVVYCGGIAASGGYYIASAGDYIIASETSLIGSIGIIAQFANFEKLFDKVGISMNVITSKTWDGKKSYKDMGSFTREMTPEEKEIFQKLIKQMWDRFVFVVAEGRKGHLTEQQVKMLANGRIYTAKDAMELKLIDANGYKEDAFNKAKELAKLSDAKLVSYRHKYNFWQDIFDSKYQSKSLLPEPKEILDMQTPKFMYLWGGYSSSNED